MERHKPFLNTNHFEVKFRSYMSTQMRNGLNIGSLFALLLLLITAIPDVTLAQSGLDAQDLSNVRSADVTDAQLQTYLNRAESEGISVDEAFQMARQRGLPASEAQRLRERVRDLDRESDEDRDREQRMEQDRPEQEIERPPRIESMEERRIFGSRIFREERTQFTPSMNIPTPSTYVVGPGDELVVTIWGDATNMHRLTVSPEGTVQIDNLGPIYIAGLEIDEASDRIIDQLSSLYSGLRPGSDQQNTYAQVSLNRLRSIQVTVVGDVHNPGDYTVNSLATVFNALYRSGGPNNRGSYRNIKVVRNSEVVSTFDIYDFLIHGDQSDNIRLRDQDVIMVEPYDIRVDITGEVKRGGLFEIKEDESLADLIRFSGNFTDKAYTRQIHLRRNTPTERRIVSVQRDEFGNLNLHSGDEIYVDEILDRFENRVSISGAVWREGEFELREDMTLYNLIQEADGIRPDAYRTRGIINRERDDFTLEQVAFSLQRVLDNPEAYDIPLQREDEIVIQSIHDMQEERNVRIRGAVQDGGTFVFRQGMTLEDLILKSDGFEDRASESRIEISRRIIGDAAPDSRGDRLAETYQFDVTRDLELRDEDKKFELQPFDQVFVHQRPDYAEQRDITIEGEVLYPGTYTIRDRNERISDIIERAGGLTNEAYVPGARLTRLNSSIDRADISLDFLAEDDVIDADTLEPLNGDENGLAENRRMEREEEEERERISRIGIDLAEIMQNPNSQENLLLKEGDVIRIPEGLETVRISGAVMQEVEVRYREGQSLGYYVDRAGGYTEDARERRAYVVYANGDVERRKRYVFGIFRSTPDIEPGAEIIIPARPERQRMTTGEIVSISSAIVSMSTSLIIAIDRLNR